MFSPHFLRSFTILAEIPLGNSTFMAKDGPDTSAGRPRCETSNFGIHAVLTLETDMVKACENNKFVGIKSGIISPVSLTNRVHYHCLRMSRAFVSTSCRFSPIDLGLSNHPIDTASKTLWSQKDCLASSSISCSIVYRIRFHFFMDVFVDVQLGRFSFSQVLFLVVGWSKLCFQVNTPYR